MILKVGLNNIQPNKPIAFAKNPKRFPETPTGDSFSSSKKPTVSADTKETFFQRFKKRIIPKTVNCKVNEMLLAKLFAPAESAYKFYNVNTISIKEFIKELSVLDYDNIEQKYTFITGEVSKYKRVVPTFIKHILKSENITADTLKSLYNLSKKSRFSRIGAGHLYHLEMMVIYLNLYDEFDTLSTKAQYDLIDKMDHYFNADDIVALDDNDDLFRFNLIKDIKALGSVELMKEKLTNIAKNSPVSYIPVDEASAKKFIDDDVFSFENLKDSIGNFNLTKYRRGIPLKYPREQFIADFQRGISDLDDDAKNEVYKYFQFSIDEANDIIKYPIPNNSSVANYPVNVQNAIILSRKPVEDFMLNNEIALDIEDKKTQDILNEFIKVFPEFVSIIGKIQHRGDSIDFHTLDDLKRCLLDPRTKELSKTEQRILFLSVMFHDIAKKQGVIDRGHQKPSAYYAKEIIKKIPITKEEKERIYNLILNSHWTTDNKNIKDTAIDFRFKNDFKMAQILANADGASAGFDFPLTESQLKDIQECIDMINSTGIPLYADNLPEDKSKFPINDEGLSYLDFTDENADLSQFGFRAGTTVGDLNFLCHNTKNPIAEVFDLCDDSKDICLSAEYKNASDGGILTKYNAGYADNCHIILHNTNENIAAGGADVTCTGEKKGYREFKNYLYMNYFQEPNDNHQKRLFSERRREISDKLKISLDLSDEEYSEFFEKVNEYASKDDIQDVVLSTGRIIEAEKIKESISKVQKQIVGNISTEAYTNEIVMFRPKIEAIVMEKNRFLKIPIEKSVIKQIAKKNNIPVILV